MQYQEVIIIGAPRSGTNMLRDVMTMLPGFGTWPCDEINFIWRHGNSRWPSDELTPELATDRVKAYLNRQFARRARAERATHVVEKTCASSLRVPFIARVLPAARYVLIYRDPVDAVASAMLRWRASFDVIYTLKKARFVPLTDIPYYGGRFVQNRLHRLRSGERRLAFWGPHLDGMQDVLDRYTLPEVCAVQWAACVKLAAAAFKQLPCLKVHVVRYEDFVASPANGLRAIDAFLDAGTDSRTLEEAVVKVSGRSVGKGRRHLDESVRERVAALAAPALAAVTDLVEERRSR